MQFRSVPENIGELFSFWNSYSFIIWINKISLYYPCEFSFNSFFFSCYLMNLESNRIYWTLAETVVKRIWTILDWAWLLIHRLHGNWYQWQRNLIIGVFINVWQRNQTQWQRNLTIGQYYVHFLVLCYLVPKNMTFDSYW